MNDLLALLSTAHFGAFTAHDAYECGYHRQSLSRLARRGPVLRVGPNAYVDRARYEAASPERQHEMATRAVVRTFDGRVFASHYSALTLMSLPVFGLPLDHHHVARAVRLHESATPWTLDPHGIRLWCRLRDRPHTERDPGVGDPRCCHDLRNRDRCRGGRRRSGRRQDDAGRP